MTYRRLPQAFSRDDLERLEYCCTDHLFWNVCIFLHETGLRIEEAVSISRAQAELWVEDGRATPLLPQAFRVIGKGNKERQIVLTRRALGSVRVMLALDRYGWTRKDKLLPWGKRAIEIHLKALGEAADVAAWPHRFRHTFIQELVDSGAPIQTVADMAGHASINTTRLYFEASPQAKAEALEGRRKFLSYAP